ncbi:enoyl-CoA hydratase/isomerase family protein [Streptosporangium sp. NPDC051023]|uniref:enoyl-CoA hydratase/isomerase family protein n=1 Tax=Streptosporangium sp. NPDC051023 TaxID=3155410 RepID=UPI00344EF53C
MSTPAFTRLDATLDWHPPAGLDVAAARRARRDFLRRHGPAVYAAAADLAPLAAGAAGLAYAAAEIFPGLAPGREDMERESRRPQPEKAGLELDQAILFHAWLSDPATGDALIHRMRRPTPAAEDLLDGFLRTGEADLGPVLLRRDGVAGHITFRNLRSLNAEDMGMIAAMQVAVDLVLLDDTIRVGVLRGDVMTHPKYAGRRVFSAGIDLVELAAGRIPYADFLLGRELGYLGKMQHGLVRDGGPLDWAPDVVHKPWIAVVDTFAIGGGMQLALVCDRVLAGTDAYFSLPAAQEGIIPGVGSLRLPRLVGPRLARQVILAGRRIQADEPEIALICDRVLDDAEMDDAVAEAIAELSAPAVAANRAMLSLAEEPPEHFRGYLAEFALRQGLRLYAPDVLAKADGFAARKGRP